MKRLSLWFSALLIFAFLSCATYTPPFTVMSPNGQVQITFNLDENGAPLYSVTYNDSVILTASPLAVEFVNSGLLAENLRTTAVQTSTIEETYDLVAGKTDSATNHCNELIVSLKETVSPGRNIQIAFRAYDDGAAFRYIFPNQGAMDSFLLVSEHTEFRFPANHSCWALRLDGFTTSYETEFDAVTLDSLNSDDTVGLPLTIEVDNGPVLAITEANLTDYAGMYLAAGSTANTLVSRLSPLPGKENLSVKAELPHQSPWRVIMIGDTPGDLVESNIILNLNEPMALQDASWIKPGKVAWDWWSGQVVDDPDIQAGMNTATMKYFIDFAA